MSREYSSEELWQLYDSLPNELKNAIFSPKTSEVIYNLCQRNNLDEKQMGEIAKEVGFVILGLLPPNELQDELKKNLNLDDDLAKKINQEIQRFIFYPIKAPLEELYNIKIKIEEDFESLTEKKEATEKIVPNGSQKFQKIKQDIYREPIE